MPTLAAAAVPDSLAALPQLLPTAEGFAPLAEALRAGRSGTVDGAWGSAAALAVAALVSEATGPVLIVIPHPADLDAFASDLRSLTGRSRARFEYHGRRSRTARVRKVCCQFFLIVIDDPVYMCAGNSGVARDRIAL